MDEFVEKLNERINQWNKITHKGSEMLEQLCIQDHHSFDKSKTTAKDEQIFIEDGAKIELSCLIKELCSQLDHMYTDYNKMIKQLEQQEQEIEVLKRIVLCLSMFEQEYKLKKTINESLHSGSPPTVEQISTVVLTVWKTQPYVNEKLIKEIV
ncbi:6732_t:CDS:2 [Ambispora leptoticha]|uniref:6732_t:CDS:1 n=1 Tax=Ambispora leptoticha TaxID=144679 RepID=A0A9N8ZZI7_9GLOM|nr:6732_t:CDS:2 [Ambispora leptoticha]